MEQVFSYKDECVSVSSFGKSFTYVLGSGDRIEGLRVLNTWAEAQNVEDVLWLLLPNDNQPERRFLVAERNSLPHATSGRCVVSDDLFDGVILTEPGQCAVLASRDCHITTLWSLNSGPVAVLHTGRTAVQGYDIDKPLGSVIRSAFELCYDSTWDDIASLRATISVGIAPEHFPNDRYPKIIEGLKRRWGDQVIADHGRSTIDVVAVIKAQLKNFAGMKDSQIILDGTDTVTDPRLASNRCKDFNVVNTTHIIKLRT